MKKLEKFDETEYQKRNEKLFLFLIIKQSLPSWAPRMLRRTTNIWEECLHVQNIYFLLIDFRNNFAKGLAIQFKKIICLCQFIHVSWLIRALKPASKVV